MSANAELVRGIFAMGSIPKQDMLAALPGMIAELCDPEIEFVETPERVDSRTYHGHEGVRQAWVRWLDQWEDYSFELEHLEERGDDVFCVAHEEGRGAGSGASADATLFTIVTFKDGKIRRYREFYDEAAARSAFEKV